MQDSQGFLGKVDGGRSEDLVVPLVHTREGGSEMGTVWCNCHETEL